MCPDKACHNNVSGGHGFQPLGIGVLPHAIAEIRIPGTPAQCFGVPGYEINRRLTDVTAAGLRMRITVAAGVSAQLQSVDATDANSCCGGVRTDDACDIPARIAVAAGVSGGHRFT